MDACFTLNGRLKHPANQSTYSGPHLSNRNGHRSQYGFYIHSPMDCYHNLKIKHQFTTSMDPPYKIVHTKGYLASPFWFPLFFKLWYLSATTYV